MTDPRIISSDSTQLINVITTTTPQELDLPRRGLGGNAYDKTATEALVAKLQDQIQMLKQINAGKDQAADGLRVSIGQLQQQVNELTRQRDQYKQDADNSIAALGKQAQDYYNASKAAGDKYRTDKQMEGDRYLADKQAEGDSLIKEANAKVSEIRQQTIDEVNKQIAASKQHSEQLVASANQTAQDIRKTADEYSAKKHSEADASLNDARAQASDIVSEANARAEQLIADAQTQAGKLVSDANAEVEGIHNEAKRRVEEALARENQAKQTLEGFRKTIGELRENLKAASEVFEN
mgnify:CR=1 FL=1